MQPLSWQLKNIIAGDVADDPATIQSHSKDASLFQMTPQVVVYPKNIDDLSKLVQFVTKEKVHNPKLSLTGRAAGTDMTGGPLTESISVDFTRYFNHIQEIGNDYAVVEPGVYYRDFEAATLKEKNLYYPSYPASRELCAIGGIVNNNSAGEKTLTYGQTKDHVLEVKVVLRDGKEYAFHPLTLEELDKKKKLKNLEGEIYRKMYDLISKNYTALQNARPKVSKNSSGYLLWDVFDSRRGIFDLSKLIVGSQGTLGLLTSAKLHLVKPKPSSRLLVIFLKDMDMLGDVVNAVGALKPESFESYDDHTFKIALKVFPAIAKRLKGNLIKLGFQFLPEFWMMLTGGIPKLVLLAEFTGENGAEAEAKALQAQLALKRFKLPTQVTKTEEEGKKYWVIRRESFQLLRQRVHGMRTAPFIDDVVVQPESLPQFLPRLYALLDEYDLIYTIAGHVGNGNFHIIPLIKTNDPNTARIVKELGARVFALTREFGGSITAEHNDGLVRTPYLKEMFGEKICSLFAETKQVFDPDNIFNPGKKVGATLEFSMSHLRPE